MATLYITEPESRIEKEYLRVIVTHEGEVIQSVPLSTLTEIVIVGTAGATTQALLTLLDKGIGITFLTRAGKMRGRLVPANHSNLPLRLRQYALQTSDAFPISIARQIIWGKLYNYRIYCARMLRNVKKRQIQDKLRSFLGPNQYPAFQDLPEAIAGLNRSLQNVPSANDLETLLGLEGIGSKHYFTVLKAHLNWKQDLGFSNGSAGRPRTP
jgi:CRISPR-associated endonuclease Cas1